MNDNGGTAGESDWTLTATAPAPTLSGPGAVGIHGADVRRRHLRVVRDGPGGLHGQCLGLRDGGARAGARSARPGDTATCTITNNDRRRACTFIKVVVNDNGGTAGESAWTLTASGTRTLGPELSGVPAW